jgi:hypothetical protein
LPKPSLITGPAKIPAMISISSMGLCGGTISGTNFLKKTDYRRERQRAIRAKRGDMLRIAKSSQRLLKSAYTADNTYPDFGLLKRSFVPYHDYEKKLRHMRRCDLVRF